MASEEHKNLAQFLKSVHSDLRTSSHKLGANIAWSEHCENSTLLKKYSNCMQKLATTHWKASDKTSRIQWAADLCMEYFNSTIEKYINRDRDLAIKVNVNINNEIHFKVPYKLIDIGSCYNPFQMYEYFDILPIDLCPANKSVYQCDFLNINIGSNTTIVNEKVIEIKEESFDVATFCFVLEYIPSSELRIKACKNAYDILKYGGLMIISTPDSKHVGANCKIMKCWQYTMSCIGFTRIKYEKFDHMHCMAFRKAANLEIAKRWATLHKKDCMKFALQIPQDSNTKEDAVSDYKKDALVCDFSDMPFSDMLIESD